MAQDLTGCPSSPYSDVGNTLSLQSADVNRENAQQGTKIADEYCSEARALQE